MPSWREVRGIYGRGRRALRRALLEPILVGRPILREVVMNALAERGHLVLCELGDVRFFVDPADRVVGSWLIWHGGWQRREIIAAVDAPVRGRAAAARYGLRGRRRPYRNSYDLCAAYRSFRARRCVRAGTAQRAPARDESRAQWPGSGRQSVVTEGGGCRLWHSGAASASAQQWRTFDRLAAIGRRPRSARRPDREGRGRTRSGRCGA